MYTLTVSASASASASGRSVGQTDSMCDPHLCVHQGCFHTWDYCETDRTEPNTEPNRTDQYGFGCIYADLYVFA